MSVSEHEEIRVDRPAMPFVNSAAVIPIKKRHFMLIPTSSPPSYVPSLAPTDCDVAQKISGPTDSDSQTASMTDLAGKGFSGLGSNVDIDLKISPPQTLPWFDHEGIGLNMSGKGSSDAENVTPGDKSAHLPFTTSTHLQPAKKSSELPMKGGIDDQKLLVSGASPSLIVPLTPEFQSGEKSEGCSVKKEKMDSYSCDLSLAESRRDLKRKGDDVESKVGKAHMFLDRVKWDLNTTMDTWGSSFRDSAPDGKVANDTIDQGGIDNKILHLGPVQVPLSDATSSKCAPETSAHNFQLSNLSASSTIEGNNMEAYLDLQLKPSSMAESFFRWGSISPLTKVDSAEEMPLLSLSMNPFSSCGPTPADLRAMEAAPCEDRSPEYSKESEDVVLGSSVLKNVKSEPCQVQEPHESTDASAPKSPTKLAVKLELLENQSQQFQNMETPCDASKHIDKALQSLVPGTSKHQKGPHVPDSNMAEEGHTIFGSCDVSMHVDMALQSLVPGTSKHQKGPQVPDSNVAEEGHTIGEALKLITQEPTLDYSETHFGANVPNTGISMCGKGTVVDSNMVEKILKAEDRDSSLVTEARKLPIMASELPSESTSSDDKEHMDTDGMSELDTQLSCADGSELAFEKGTVAENCEGKSEPSIDKTYNLEKRSNSSNDTVGAGVGDHEQFNDNYDDGYEDGDVKDKDPLELQNTTGGSCQKMEDNLAKDIDSVTPVNIPVEVTSNSDLKENKIDDSVETMIHGTANYGDIRCNYENDPVINMEPSSNLNPLRPSPVKDLNARPGKRALGKNIRKIPQDYIKGDNPERKPSPNLQKEVTSVSVSSKMEPSIKDDAEKKECDMSSTSRIINLNPTSSGLSSGKAKYIPGRLFPSRKKRDRPIGKSVRQDKSRFQRIRDQRYNHGPRIFESERMKDRSFDRRGGTELMHRSRAENQLNVLHSNQSSDHEQLREQADSLAGVPFSRPLNAPEADDSQKLSNMPYRRRYPEARRIPVGGIQMVPRPNREDNDNGYMGREVPDYVLQAHEDNLMRTLPDDMMAHPQYPRRRTRFDRAEGGLVREERRSLSPIRRTDPNFSPGCLGSSQRSQARVHHQWSPPRGSPDGRSPDASRPDRMRSPHQPACFPDEMIIRRRGSPNLVRSHDDVVGIGPLRDYDPSRQLRGSERNTRRFPMINPREISEEEYFEPLMHNQFGELAGKVECAHHSERQERLVLGHSFTRQRQNAGDEDDEALRAQPYGFPERGSPRDLDGNVRNRMGNPFKRSRAVEEQQVNYRYRGNPGWRDATGSNDARPNRRRFERN